MESVEQRGSTSLQALREELERSRDDIGRLKRLLETLEPLTVDPKFNVLRLMVMSAHLKARGNPGPPPGNSLPVTATNNAAPPPRHALSDFLAARSLSTPDGRTLHSYRVTEPEVEQLLASLQGHAKFGRLANPSRIVSAEFVLYSAEWFRRAFAGGVYSWEHITEAIGGQITPQARAVLVEQGLGWWRRPLRHSASGQREFLLSCVLEGGFPTRLLESREHGWLNMHLRRLVSHASTLPAQTRSDGLDRYAVTDYAVRPSFRRDEFRTLCVELASAIIDLRNEVAGLTGATGGAASAKLDRHRPDWRDGLPLVIEGAGAEKLLDDLLSAPVEALGGSEARCWRLLVKTGDSWELALRLSVDGQVSALPAGVANDKTRLRVAPAGRLADFVSGEIALLDPPGDQGAWLARARPGAPQGPILRFPLAACVEVELRREGALVGRMPWRGGEPVRREVLTFFDEGGDGSNRVMVLIGGGSCRSRHSPVYVLAPCGHRAHDSAGEPILPGWIGEIGQLFEIDRLAYVGSDKDEDSRYRIEPGANAERSLVLAFDGPLVRGLSGTDGDDIYAGPPRVWIVKDGHRQDARKVSHDVFWRHVGSRDWVNLASRNLEPGVIDVLWRDTQSRAAHDRQRVMVLPATTEFRAEALPGAGARLSLEKAGPWRLSAAESADLRQTQDGDTLEITWIGTPRRSVDVRLRAPGHSETTIRAAFPLKRGAFVGANGRLLPPDAIVTLSQLRGAVAIVQNQGNLQIEPVGAGQGWSQVDKFSLEYPLWSLRDELEALLGEAGNLDSEVRLRVDPGGVCLRVRQYTMKFSGPIGLRARLAAATALSVRELTFKWRSLIDASPAGERVLEPIEDDPPGCALPTDLSGPGVIYACRDGVLTVRPTLVPSPLFSAEELTKLQFAALVSNTEARKIAIRTRLDEIGAGASDFAEDIVWLHSILALPDRIPAPTFDVFKALPSSSSAAVALLFGSKDVAALERVWRLEQALPLLWVLCRVEDWVKGHAAALAHRSAQIEMSGLTPEEASDMARQSLFRLTELIGRFDEGLMVPLQFAGLLPIPAEPLRHPRDIAQDRIRRSGDRQEAGTQTTCFKLEPLLGGNLNSIAPWRSVFDESHWRGLDAPVFAALVAAGRVEAEHKHRLAIRQARREDPQHFSEAYGVALGQIARLS